MARGTFFSHTEKEGVGQGGLLEGKERVEESVEKRDFLEDIYRFFFFKSSIHLRKIHSSPPPKKLHKKFFIYKYTSILHHTHRYEECECLVNTGVEVDDNVDSRDEDFGRDEDDY